MNEIYSSKFLKKEKKISKKYINNLFSRVLICVVLYLSSMIFVNYSASNKELFHKYTFDVHFNFNYFTGLYNKYFGSILPIEEMPEDKLVFNETLAYKNLDNYRDGFMLEVGTNYLVPILKSGIIVYIGDKENYGNTVIVQGVDGVDIWYSNVNLVEYSLYDFVSEGHVLGEASSDYIYLTFCKNGTFIGYETYIN